MPVRINRTAMKVMLKYHQSQVESWEETLKDPKQQNRSWNKESYEHHKGRVRDLLKLLQDSKAG